VICSGCRGFTNAMVICSQSRGFTDDMVICSVFRGFTDNMVICSQSVEGLQNELDMLYKYVKKMEIFCKYKKK
jgi:hypothetical protein